MPHVLLKVLQYLEAPFLRVLPLHRCDPTLVRVYSIVSSISVLEVWIV